LCAVEILKWGILTDLDSDSPLAKATRVYNDCVVTCRQHTLTAGHYTCSVYRVNITQHSWCCKLLIATAAYVMTLCVIFPLGRPLSDPYDTTN